MSEAEKTTDAPAAREFRPSWKGFHRRLWRRWALLLPFTVLILFLAAGPQVGFLFVSLGTPMLLAGLYASLYFSRAKVTVQDGTVSFTRAFRTRRWSVSDVAHLVFVPQPGGMPGRPAPATLYAVTFLNERLFWLSGEPWERSEQEAIADAIGATVHTVPAGLTPKEIAERYPGTIGWTTLRPWLFALTLAASALAFMFVLTVVVAAIMLATGQITLPTAP